MRYTSLAPPISMDFLGDFTDPGKELFYMSWSELKDKQKETVKKLIDKNYLKRVHVERLMDDVIDWSRKLDAEAAKDTLEEKLKTELGYHGINVGGGGEVEATSSTKESDSPNATSSGDGGEVEATSSTEESDSPNATSSGDGGKVSNLLRYGEVTIMDRLIYIAIVTIMAIVSVNIVVMRIHSGAIQSIPDASWEIIVMFTILYISVVLVASMDESKIIASRIYYFNYQGPNAIARIALPYLVFIIVQLVPILLKKDKRIKKRGDSITMDAKVQIANICRSFIAFPIICASIASLSIPGKY